jgi:hypothetical protein
MLQNFIRKKGIYIAITITVCGLIGIPILMWFASVIVIDSGTILLLLLCSGMLGLILWKYVKDDIDMEYHHFAMYAFAGFGMCLVNLILLLNFTIRINSHSETYKIARFGYDNQIILTGNADYIALERNLDTYVKEHLKDSYSAEKVRITFDTGLFGFDMINNCTFSN